MIQQAVGIAAWQVLSNLGNNTQLRAKLTCEDNPLQLQTNWLTENRATYVGCIEQVLPPVPKALQTWQSRNVAVALALVDAMQTHIDNLTAGLPKQRLGLVIGTSTSGLSQNEAAIAHLQENQPLPNDFAYSRQHMNATCQALQTYLGWMGPCFTISTACSSAAKAILAGQRLLQSGVCDAVLVGGIDTLCRMTFNGFDSLESLSAKRCRPFAQNRDGINIGEGGGLFLLTPNRLPLMLRGGGESSDAWHISAPHPQGKGAQAAMQQALQLTGLQAADIDYVNLHGTGTPQNDAMEALAIRAVFGNHTPWLSSTKHQTGHCLGAAGAVEAAICCAVLEDQEVWLPWHQSEDSLDADMQDLNFVRPQTPINTKISRTMSNSFAFGGSNACLIFESNHD